MFLSSFNVDDIVLTCLDAILMFLMLSFNVNVSILRPWPVYLYMCTSTDGYVDLIELTSKPPRRRTCHHRRKSRSFQAVTPRQPFDGTATSKWADRGLLESNPLSFLFFVRLPALVRVGGRKYDEEMMMMISSNRSKWFSLHKDADRWLT